MSGPRVLAFVAKEFREMVPPTLFFMVGFNLVVLTGHLVIDDYRRQLFNYMLATTTAWWWGSPSCSRMRCRSCGGSTGRP